ncbi:MAG: serine/threonine-protein kinase [Cyanobacteria bacterium P01_F01_bin.86]
MSLCINPDCPQPSAPGNAHSPICQSCGSGLLLQERYRVMRLLSSKTGFGTVYEAYEQDVPKILKVLKRDRSEDPKVIDLFQQEAKVLSQIHHPGVPFISGDGYFTYLPKNSATPLHCIVMEKIDGPNLQQWMQQQGNHPIGESQAFQWLTQLVDILRRVHQHNYFHRDIKPDNVMLRGDGQLVLVDFGAVREMTQTYLAQIGSLGITTVSSAGYTPPEQEQGQAVPQSDFYAMGRTIIYLLTGRSPNDTSLYDPMLNTFTWRPHASQVSDEFANLLDSLIAPRVVDRPKTALEIQERLQRLSRHPWIVDANTQTLLAATSLPENQPPISDARSAALAKSSKFTGWTWLIIGGATLAAGCLISLGVWSRNHQRNRLPASSNTTISAPVSSPLPIELLRTFSEHTSSVNALQLLSDKQRFISAGADSTVRLWHLSTGKMLQVYEGHTTFVNAIALSPDEKTLYSGSADGAIYRWDLTTGRKQGEFPKHPGAVNTLARTPDGRLLVSGFADGVIKLWSTKSQEIVQTLEGHNGAVNTLVVTDDGQHVISGGTDRTLRFWDIASGEMIQVWEGHDSYINAIAVSPDGRSVFSASADQTIKRWNLDTGEVLDTLGGHSSYINALTLSRDGQTVSSGSADQTVRVWNVTTGKLLAVYTGFNMPVDQLIVLSDKQFVTASKENSAIKVWLASP